MDSEYILLQQLTEKSDFYSFGVVLFVILRARPVMDTSLLEEQANLVEWVVHCQNISFLDQMTGPYLKGKIAPECFKQYVVTAMKCVANQGRDRPSMAEVLWNLELSLQLQASAEEINEGIVKMHIEEETFAPHAWKKDSDVSPSYDDCGGSFSREVTCQKLNVGHLWTGFF